MNPDPPVSSPGHCRAHHPGASFHARPFDLLVPGRALFGLPEEAWPSPDLDLLSSAGKTTGVFGHSNFTTNPEVSLDPIEMIR